MTKRNVSWALCLGLGLALGTVAGAEEPQPAAAREQTVLALSVGQTVKLPLGDATRIAVQDPAVADARVEGSSALVVTGLSAGSTVLRIWRADGGRESIRVDITP